MRLWKAVVGFVFAVSYLPLAMAAGSPAGTWTTIDDKTGAKRAVVSISVSGGTLNGTIVKVYPQAGDTGICSKCPGSFKGKKIQGWEGVDDFTDPRFDDALGVLTAQLKTSLSSQGEPLTVYMVGSYQEASPYGHMGDPTEAKVEDSHRDLETAAKHTIAIIKAIDKIKVPLKSSPREDIEKL